MSARRVLIVEDQTIIALDMGSMLEESGFQPVIVCNSAKEANLAIDLALPDLGIVDIGRRERRQRLETAARLGGHARPVLLLTDGTNPLNDLPEALQDYDVIVKPFSDTDLLRSIEDLVLGKGQAAPDLPDDAPDVPRPIGGRPS